MHKFKHPATCNNSAFYICVKKEIENIGNIYIWGWPSRHANRIVWIWNGYSLAFHAYWWNLAVLLVNSFYVVCILSWRAVIMIEVSQGFTKSHQTNVHSTECSFKVELSAAEWATSLIVVQKQYHCCTACSPTIKMTPCTLT